MRIIDISMAIDEDMQVYKNRESKRPRFQTASDFRSGSVYESVLSINLHTGTHIDAPKHMAPDGETMEAYDLDRFYGTARVIDLTGLKARRIEADDLKEHGIECGDIILLKTANSLCEHFEPDFVYLTASGAQHLARIGVRAVGIDALGIERDAPGHPAHKALLNLGIPIIEGLRLGHVESGTYGFAAFPVKISGVEASPARAVLIDS